MELVEIICRFSLVIKIIGIAFYNTEKDVTKSGYPLSILYAAEIGIKILLLVVNKDTTKITIARGL